MDLDFEVSKGALCSRYPSYETEESRPLRFVVLHLPQVRMPLEVYIQFIQSAKFIDSENLYISWTSTLFSLSTLKAVLPSTITNFGCTSCSLFNAVHGGLPLHIYFLQTSTSLLEIIVDFSITGCYLLIDSCLDVACCKILQGCTN